MPLPLLGRASATALEAETADGRLTRLPVGSLGSGTRCWDHPVVGDDVVFISYSHLDRVWLDRLLILLQPLVRNQRLRVWADPYLEIGSDWRRDIVGAVDRAGLAVLLVSADFLASPFIMDEEVPALAARGVPLAPVLVRECLWQFEELLERVQWAHDPVADGPLDRGSSDTPADRDGRLVKVCMSLIKRVGVGMMPGLQADVAPSAVVAGVAVPEALVDSAAPGLVDGVPPLPLGYVERADLEPLRAAVLRAPTGAVGVTGNAATLGLYGQGGIGKSVLAAALARDERVQRYFPDGVFWVTVGERADPVAVQADLLRRLGKPDARVRSTGDGLRALREVLAIRRVLLVVDDVWRDADAAAFRVAGPQGRVLYTSRDFRVLAAVGAEKQQVDVLPETAARRLLATVSGVGIEELPVEADRVAEATGRVPLALALVAAAVRGGMSWTRLAEKLDQGARTFLDHPYANTFKAMQVATSALPTELRNAYVSLAVFPPDTGIPVRAVERLWNAPAGADLAGLAEAGLLAVADDRMTFHDLQHDYLMLQADDLAVLHGDLLAAYRQLLPDGADDGWWQLPADEPYIWDHLLRHLHLAGNRADLRATATDAAFLCCRIAFQRVHAAEADLTFGVTVMPGNPDVLWLQSWLARHAHLFATLGDVGDVAAAMSCWLGVVGNTVGPERLRPLLPSTYLRPRWGLSPLPQAAARTLTGHAGFISTVAFSADGRLLASGDHNGSVRLWDPLTGRQQAELISRIAVTSVAFSPDGRLLASGGADGVVRLWDTVTGRLQTSFHSDSTVNAVAFSPSGAMVAVACRSGSVQLWDPVAQQRGFRLAGHAKDVNAVAFSPDGRLLASAGDDGLQLWNPITGRRQAEFIGASVVAAAAFSPDGMLLASAGNDGFVRLWDLATGRQEAGLDCGRAATAVAFSPDGRLLATADFSGMLRLWDPATGRPLGEVTVRGSTIAAVAFSPDGRLLASAGNSGVIQLWDPATGQQESGSTDRDRAVAAVAVSPDGRTVACARGGRTVALMDSAAGRQRVELVGHTETVAAVAFSPDGRLLVSSDHGGSVRVWDPVAGRQRSKFDARPAVGAAVAVSPDGRLLATADGHRSVRLWDLTTSRQAAKLKPASWTSTAVEFSPDGRVLATFGGSVRLWDPVTGQKRAELSPTRMIMAVSFSPDGRVLAGGDIEGSVRLWTRADGQQQAELVGQAWPVNAVAFSPDGQMLASGGDDGVVTVWDMRDGSVINRLPLGRRVRSISWRGSLICVAAHTVVMLEIAVGSTAHAGGQVLDCLLGGDEEQDDQRNCGDCPAGERS